MTQYLDSIDSSLWIRIPSLFMSVSMTLSMSLSTTFLRVTKHDFQYTDSMCIYIYIFINNILRNTYFKQPLKTLKSQAQRFILLKRTHFALCKSNNKGPLNPHLNLTSKGQSQIIHTNVIAQIHINEPPQKVSTNSP